MLDANLYTLSFIKSLNESHKLVLMEEKTGEPIYYRTFQLKDQQQIKINLFHSLTNAHLGTIETLNHKIKLITLFNPNQSIELKNSSLIHWEWSFIFNENQNHQIKEEKENLKFCWKRDLLGLKTNRKGLGYTCWLIRKPDPDYPCAIYKPENSNQPGICQILDFNIKRIEGIEDKRGLEIVMILSLLGFIESISNHEVHKPKRSNTPDQTLSNFKIPIEPLTSTELTQILNEEIEPNEILINEEEKIDSFIEKGLKLLKDEKLLYIFINAIKPKMIPIAVKVAECIKRIRFKEFQEDLKQYLIDDIMSQNLKGKGKQIQSNSNSISPIQSNTLKIYLSRTSLDELLPKKNPTSNQPTKSPKFTN